MAKKVIVLVVLTSLVLGGCIPQKRLEYLQEPVDIENQYKTVLPEEVRIQANDELLINVSSFDDISFNYFEAQRNGTSMQASNELSLTAISYTVNDSGYVMFPIIEEIKFVGLTLKEATDKLIEELAPFFDQPNVRIKFAYKSITVIGEVNSPGYLTYTRNQINIFEAIGLARDLTVHGNRKEVYLIRSEGDNTTKKKIDLTKDNLVFSDNYYLKPNDIIYVKPRKSVKWNVVSTPIALIFSTITTALLVLNAIQ